MCEQSNLVKRKYSKSSDFYFGAKKTFFIDNEKLLARALRQNSTYASQIRRQNCKLCGFSLSGNVDFASHGVQYQFCNACSHLNGLNKDTEEFVNSLYVADGGKEYATNYVDTNYETRVRDIYRPKIDFFVDSIEVEIKSLLDVGCGAGHFVYAALNKGIDAKGIDVNKSLIDYGNSLIGCKFGCEPLTETKEMELYDRIIDSNADVISALAIFEHLRNPELFIEAFKLSKAKFLYYSVPMYSLSVIVENVFPEVFPRHLSGGHTQLFSEDSILKLNDLLGVQPIAEWRFGTDFLDLYRSLLISMKNKGGSDRFLDMFETALRPIVDELQSSFDKRHFCSQIHVVAQKI